MSCKCKMLRGWKGMNENVAARLEIIARATSPWGWMLQGGEAGFFAMLSLTCGEAFGGQQHEVSRSWS